MEVALKNWIANAFASASCHLWRALCRHPKLDSQVTKKSKGILMSRLRHFAILSVTSIALFLSACNGGSYSRGIFEGQVTGQTEEAVVEKVGKPDVIDNSNANLHKFVYKGRTFDTNANGQKDVEAIITFEKDASGKFVATGVFFS
jgi:hypothetical protein